MAAPTPNSAATAPPAKRRSSARATAERAARPGRRDAFRLARAKWRRGERIDMSALARELAINRATLYRWVGSRERLLVDVIWNLSNHIIDTADSQVRERGVERIVQVVTRFIDKAITHQGMQTWLANEGESAIRLLTRHQAGFQPQLVSRIEALLREEVDAGRLDLPADVHEVAYVLEQLIESYVYLYQIAGERPQARRAEPILRMLLR
jgi:AcrR family transcriptional regulator